MRQFIHGQPGWSGVSPSLAFLVALAFLVVLAVLVVLIVLVATFSNVQSCQNVVETTTAPEQVEQCAVVFAVVVAVTPSRADVVLLRRVVHLFVTVFVKVFVKEKEMHGGGVSGCGTGPVTGTF